MTRGLIDDGASGAPRCRLCVVIKTLNEEANIARCIKSAMRALSAMSHRIVVADSLSSDATVAIARQFPVLVVQLEKPEQRSCGAGAQLGFQFCNGEFLLLLDGDMTVEPSFVAAALEAMASDAKIAAVGGLLRERSEALEFRLRRERRSPHFKTGDVEFLSGAGLYRMSALNEMGYFMDRNLHCCEEFELGLRLRRGGWRLVRLASVAVEHYGHTLPAWRLFRLRLRTKYFWGYGELLRSAWNSPSFLPAARSFWRSFVVMGWWAAMGILAAVSSVQPRAAVLAVAVAAVPPVAAVVAKKSLSKGLYLLVLWNVIAGGMIAGGLRRPVDPRTPLDARLVSPVPSPAEGARLRLSSGG